mmetsp:Transcript_43925/g.137910  ORF Transcript_43925/g.137910 Transcript_43925/m.137910 type:complete len:193 (-) Transcript_43925:88-666(-)
MAVKAARDAERRAVKKASEAAASNVLREAAQEGQSLAAAAANAMDAAEATGASAEDALSAVSEQAVKAAMAQGKSPAEIGKIAAQAAEAAAKELKASVENATGEATDFSVTTVVSGLDFEAISAAPAVRDKLVAVVKRVVSSDAGHGTREEDVAVGLSPGSVTLAINITLHGQASSNFRRAASSGHLDRHLR